jgi:RimJ/RimL family protein N-acetyltransferase
VCGASAHCCDDRGVLAATAPIESERLRLRPFAMGDLEGLAAIQVLPEVARFLYWEPRTREEVEPALAQLIAKTEIESEDESISLAVQPRAGGPLLGYVSLWLRSEEHRQAEIGFVFHPDAQGHGYATEATRVVLRLAFEQLHAHRVFGRTDGRNQGSANLMRRLGMRQEAHFREAEMFKGAWADELVFAILHRDWEDGPFGT